MFSARVFLIFHDLRPDRSSPVCLSTPDHEREQEQDIPTPTRTRVTNATSTRPALALANAVPAKPSNGGARLVRAPAKPDHAENAKGKGKEKAEEAKGKPTGDEKKDKVWPRPREELGAKENGVATATANGTATTTTNAKARNSVSVSVSGAGVGTRSSVLGARTELLKIWPACDDLKHENRFYENQIKFEDLNLITADTVLLSRNKDKPLLKDRLLNEDKDKPLPKEGYTWSLRRVRVQTHNGSGESEAPGDCDRHRGKAAKRGCVAGAAIYDDDDDEEQRCTHASSSSSRAEAQAETQTQNGVYKHEGVNRSPCLLTQAERTCFAAQTDLARAPGWRRPVRWIELGARMHDEWARRERKRELALPLPLTRGSEEEGEGATEGLKPKTVNTDVSW
ncbi:hypothetical protein C8R45DRAFT_928591 [Mycena sanguinolenta]|nr:hypothetical protein C8R45DRAFT_928591 [Mycena sanguinolenta]